MNMFYDYQPAGLQSVSPSPYPSSHWSAVNYWFHSPSDDYFRTPPPEFRLLNPSASEIQKEHPHKYISKHMFEEPRKGRRKPPGGI